MQYNCCTSKAIGMTDETPIDTSAMITDRSQLCLSDNPGSKNFGDVFRCTRPPIQHACNCSESPSVVRQATTGPVALSIVARIRIRETTAVRRLILDI